MTLQPDWEAIKAEYEGGLSLRALAAKYGVSKSAIDKRKRKEQWTQLVDKWTVSNTQKVIHPDRNASVRAATGFRLRFEECKTWQEVADGAGYASRGAARNAVLREAERHVSHDIKEIRDEELYRLSRLQARCYKEAMDKDNENWTWVADRYVAFSKRKSELMNLDLKSEEQAAQQPYTKRIILTHQTGGQGNAS